MRRSCAYLSSTKTDLESHRDRALSVIQSCGMDVRAMEFYTATSDRPREFCVDDVAGCDLYIGLFAFRYGYTPPGELLSITEQEYRQACQSDIPALIFLADENYSWDPRCCDQGPDRQRIQNLRAHLQEEWMVSFFTTPEDLATKLATALANFQRGGRQRRVGPLGLATGQCAQCKHTHGDWQAHSVCDRCGSRTQEPCPRCDTPNGVWSPHCRQCQVNIPHEILGLRKEVDSVLREVAACAKARRLEDAQALLDRLYLPAHSAFAERRKQVERERIRLRQAVARDRHASLIRELERRFQAEDWLAAGQSLAQLRSLNPDDPRLEKYREHLARGLRTALLESPEDRPVRQLYLAERTERQREMDEREGRKLESRMLWSRTLPLLILSPLLVPLLFLPKLRGQVLERSAPRRFRDYGPLPWEALALDDRDIQRRFLTQQPTGKLEDGFEPLRFG